MLTRRGRLVRTALVSAVTGSLLAAGTVVVALRADDGRVAARPSPPTRIATGSPTGVPPPPLAELAIRPGAGQPATNAGVAAVLDRLLGDASLGSRVTAAVTDVATSRVLYARNATVPVLPASTAKLSTAVAALTTLGADTTLATRLVAAAAPAGGVLSGDLVLVGGGDSTLASPAAEDLFPRSARVSDLVTALQRAGVKRITGRVVVDGSAFSGPTLAPGWKPNYVSEGSVAPVTAVMADSGRRTPDDDKRFADPDLAVGQLLKSLLVAAGVVVDGGVDRGVAPAQATQLAEVRSPPMTSLVERMLSLSDNNLAESLGRLVGKARGLAGSFDGAAEGTRGALRELGVSDEGGVLYDSSGLSTRDRSTAAGLVALLRLAADPGHPALRPVLTGLAVGGFDGTLANRYRESDEGSTAAGWVRAKTGTLDNVTTLAGVVLTRGGRVLAFALSADRLPTKGTGKAAAALDRAVAALRACGCDG